MGKVITIAHQKGGVGKTTTAINLSSCIAVTEKPVLLIDVDPQSNATSGLGLDITEEQKTIYEVIIEEGNPREAIFPLSIP